MHSLPDWPWDRMGLQPLFNEADRRKINEEVLELHGDIFPCYGDLKRNETLPKIEHMPKEAMCPTTAS